MKSSYFEGCQDHACLIQKPKQGTNGGRCRCSHAKIEAYINALKEERTLAEKKLAIAESGLAMVKALYRIEPPEEVSDYEQGVISGFEMAAEIAFKAITEMEATK